VNHLQPDQTDTDEGDPESKEDGNVQQAQTASNGARIYRARGGVTPWGRRLSAVCLPREEKLLQLHLPC
jgi:hypothetical protein